MPPATPMTDLRLSSLPFRLALLTSVAAMALALACEPRRAGTSERDDENNVFNNGGNNGGTNNGGTNNGASNNDVNNDVNNDLDPLADEDDDGIANADDNCPRSPNNSQADGDNDRVGDACDNCPEEPNFSQADADNDGYGDLCDNCPGAFNPNQRDSDNNGVGDVCDPINHPVENPSFDDVADALMNNRCWGCHGTSAGLSVRTADAITTAGAAIPRMPDSSTLLTKLRTSTLPYGRLMPLGAASDADGVSDDELQTIRNWIADGANATYDPNACQ